MLLAHKIRLYPNKEQETYFRKACGASRWAYNWALAQNMEAYEAAKASGEKPKFLRAFTLSGRLTKLIPTDFPWIRETSRSIVERGLMDAERAFKNFFAKRAGYPRFHSKYKGRDSFYTSNQSIKFDDKRLKLAKCPGLIKMAEALRFTGKVMGGTISRQADRWFLAVQVDTEAPPQIHGGDEVQAAGVDLGIAPMATVSDGTTYQLPDQMKRLWKRLRQAGKALSRKVGSKKGEEKSKNFQKARIKLAKIYARMVDLRSDYTHKMTTELTERFGLIGVETLDLRGMVRNNKLARELLNRNLGEVGRQIEYKAAMKGGRVFRADKLFPSSQTCSVCGYRNNEVSLRTTKWKCPECGAEHEKHHNAAMNLKNLAEASTVTA